MLVNAGTREERVAAQADVHACEQSLFELDDFKMFCCLPALSYQGKLLMVDYATDHYVKGEIFRVAKWGGLQGPSELPPTGLRN
ncbi:hypothetical protein ACFX11_037730 [Malus domestica]